MTITDRVIKSVGHIEGLNFMLKPFSGHVFRAIHKCPRHWVSWSGKKVLLCLSFDCDRHEDTESLPVLTRCLDRYGIKASFAVCGELVAKDTGPYRGLKAKGHEIINHGYSRHAMDTDDQGAKARFFYNDLTDARIEKEILGNHDAIRSMLGYEASGFRVPHFGTFQKQRDMERLYRILRACGYIYSSSVLSVNCFRYGCNTKGSLIEFPLSGLYGYPSRVLDSWSFLGASKRRWRDEDFYIFFKLMLEAAASSEDAMFLNIYADPRDVAGSAVFMQCMEHLNTVRDSVWTGTYTDILTGMKKHGYTGEKA